MRKNVLFKSLLALALVLISGSVWAQSDYSTTYSSNITLSADGGTNASACKVKVDGTEYDGIKAGTGKAAGAMKITVPSGTKYLHMHVSAWKGASVTLKVTPENIVADIELTADDGISNNSPFTFSGDPSKADYYKVITFANALTADTDLTFTATGGTRFVVWGVTAEEESNPGDQSVITTITIDDSGLTNKDLYQGTAAGSLKAVVSTEKEVISGAVVSWTSTNEAVAKINDAGVVTLVAVGTTTIKASYAGVENQYKPSTKSYELTVTNNDPNVLGTKDNPYTVADARKAIDAGTGLTGVYAKGIVSEIVTAYNSQFGNITYNISEDGTTTTEQLQAYRGKSYNGEKFTSADDIQVGDVVVVYGNLKKYNTTYEFDADNQLVSLTRPTVAVAKPTFTPDGGTFTEAQTVTIACETEGAAIYYTIDGSTPTSSSTKYTGAVTVQRTMTLSAIAVKGSDASAVVTAVFAIVEASSAEKPYTVARAREIIDMNKTLTFAGVYVGGKISQIDKFNDNDKSVTYWISDDGTTTNQFEVYHGKGLNGADFASKDDVQLGANVVVSGDVLLYNNSTYEFSSGSKLVYYQGDETASITVTPTSKEIDCSEQTVELDVVLKNIDEDEGVDVLFYDAKGATETQYDWIQGSFDAKTGKATLSVVANTGDEARTAYLMLVGFDADADLIYSDLVTITQKKYEVVVDYATLPFEYDGNGKGELPFGLTAEGLETYSSSPAMKFDTTGDNLILKINENPGKLSFDIKGNPGSGTWSGTFTVQTSADGETYTDLATYTNLTSTVQSESFVNLASTVRFIKWVFTEKGNGNVALGNIKLQEYVELQKYAVHYGQMENVEVFAFLASDDSKALAEGAEVLSGEKVNLSVSPAQNYKVEKVSVTTAGGVEVALTSIGEDYWSFTMPEDQVTITATVKEIVPVVTTTYKLATTVEPGKHYIFVGKKEDVFYAMGKQNNNNRAAEVVAVGDNGIYVDSDADVYEFVLSGCAAGYVIYDENEASTGYLYAASNGSNHLKTTAQPDANAKWTISFDAESGAATISAQGDNSRNRLRYNSSSTLFSCYASGQQEVWLYVRDGDESSEPESFYKVFNYTYATLCLPFAAALPDGVEAFYASEYNETFVTLTKLPDNIPANAGVVLSKGAEVGTFVKFVKTTEASRIPENYLKGVTEPTAFDAVAGYDASKRYYAMQAVEGEAKFCLVEGGSYAANTAYLELPAGSSQALGLRFGDATMVEAVKAAAEQNVIYDLTGRRVEKVTKGLYIVNGKKVFMK